MTHIIVSPHFDDGIGSCGGTISRLRRCGEEVVVFTVCGASPAPPYSRLAAELHAQWNCGDSPIGVRSAEDARACRSLDCEQRFSEVLDAIYRRSRVGTYLYPDERALFGGIADDDGDLPARVVREIRARWSCPETRWYVPLGVGHHVDHVMAFRAGLEALRLGYQVWFYEDFFYTDWDCPHLEGRCMTAGVEPFSAADFDQKVKAFGHYESQIPMLFGSAKKAASYFAEFNRKLSPNGQFGEVFWQLAS